MDLTTEFSLMGPGCCDTLMIEAERDAVLESIGESDLVCELGAFRCASTRYWSHCRKDAQFVAVDPFKDFGACVSCAIRLRPESLWVFVGRTTDFAQIARPGGYDVVIVDASHEYEDCVVDMGVADTIVKSSGTIWAHDYRSAGKLPGVTRAVDEFCERTEWTVATIVNSMARLEKQK